jgi:tetratricopeptide (TPR) repeat protein
VRIASTALTLLATDHGVFGDFRHLAWGYGLSESTSRKQLVLPPNPLRFGARYGSLCIAICVAFFGANLGSLLASDLDDVKKFYRTGDYAACIELAKSQVEKGIWNDVWSRTLIEAYLETGEYALALDAYEKALEKYSNNLRLRLLGIRVYRMNNKPLKALEQLAAIDEIWSRTLSRFSGRSDLVPLGEYFLMRGEDPKNVLKLCFDAAIKGDPKPIEAHLASARLALDKHDDKVASQSLDKALKLEDQDPEIFCLLAKAWSSTDSAKSQDYLTQSLKLNPRYVPSLIMHAEARMSSEDYEGAKLVLSEVEKTNAFLPKLWALRAAIAHLQGVYAEEGECRRKGLIPWSLNPEVDFVIGQQLSKHYRFAESAEYQRRALTMDPEYTPAKAQLAQDLLRLGELDAGWQWVDTVRVKDPYDVTVFNLHQLKVRLEKFETIEVPGFVIRMDKTEAAIYGQDVVELLSEARTTLTKKYSVQLNEPIYVEIFPRQREFAIRTFGLPGGEGFLGVCFGRLITANSPAALKVDSNWRSVLWHEYCHVVTLQKTKNKMPRWLSEGISVYEERQRDPKWGQAMDTVYRDMILGEDFVPMSRLSGAFLRPNSPVHLQFAYYEASLAVEFWIEKYGVAGLLKLLDDLAVGMPPQDALQRLPGSLDALDMEFQEYATKLANAYGPGVDFSQPTDEEKRDLGAWLEQHPQSILGLRSKCSALIRGKKWEEAAVVAEQLRKMLPEDSSNDGVYGMLATIYRNLERTEQERDACQQLVERSSDCRQALMRLIELDRAKADWNSVRKWCDHMLAIDPLRFDLQNTRAMACEQLGAPEPAIRSLKACLELDPVDPANLHYRLAVALEKTKQYEQAKRHVLMALEESPRYLDALKLLASLVKSSPPQSESQ